MEQNSQKPEANKLTSDKQEQIPSALPTTNPPKEIGGRKGPEPTRYGDWENAGKCVDF